MQHKKGGLIFGVIMGTILGVLFAPKKGKELRKQLGSEIKEGGIGAETIKENFIEMGEDMAKTAKSIYEGSEVEDQVNEQVGHAKKYARKVRRQVHQTGTKLKKMGGKYYRAGRNKMQKAVKKVEDTLEKIKDGLPGQERQEDGDKKDTEHSNRPEA